MAISSQQEESTNVSELQAFVELRDRVNRVIEEIERLRKENAGLKAQIEELETSGGGGSGELDLFSEGESTEDLKARIEGFIAAINDVLGESADAS